MHRIHSIDVVGFRGSNKPLKLVLKGDVNFLIGRNGTGKTSLINLINSSLSVDLRGMLQSQFTEVNFRLNRSGSRKKSNISVKKLVSEESDEPLFTYEILDSTSGQKHSFKLRAFDRSPWHRLSYNRIIRGPQDTEDMSDVHRVKTAIGVLIQTSWISVHRATSRSSDEDEKKFDSPVDRKLHQVARDFSVYFSTLDKLAAAESDKFQQIYLLSLISPPAIEQLSSVGGFDAEEEKSALKGIFSEFKIRAAAYASRVDAFTRRMEKAVQNYKPHQAIASADFLALTDTIRIHDLIKEWHKLLKTREDIYKPKSDFVSIVNELFYRKSLRISAGNEPQFFDENDSTVALINMSSGEKQLFILLGETLLQQSAECVFMADEPELSLHIDWQEKLVPSLRRINPSAQILFATHSPDIVGAYGASAINLEKIV